MMQPGDVMGDYEIVDTLGRGGMGVVYLAQPRTGATQGRAVALKTLITHGPDARSRERFHNEHQVLAMLKHDGIVASEGPLQTEGNITFFAMELVEGKSLRHILDEQGTLKPAHACALMLKVLDGLGAAHAKDVVHRDIKPANILLSRSGAVKVADFGLAHVLDWSRLTVTSGVLGTPYYMAPEQIDGKSVDARSDLYATGAVLFELLAGRPPFTADNAAAMLLCHLESKPPKLSRLNGQEELRPFDDLFVRALAKDPNKRFETAAALAQAITDACPEATDTQLAPLLAGDGSQPTMRIGNLLTAYHKRRRRKIWRWLAAGLSTCIVAAGIYLAWPQPRPMATVQQRSGPALRGYVISTGPSGVVLELPNGERQRIELANVASLRYDEP